MNGRKQTLVLWAGCFGLLLLLAGVAWACTVSPFISIRPFSGPAGTTVLDVSGAAFSEGAPVEIRWNRADGPVVGNANGPAFSVTIQPPPGTPAGYYYILAIQPEGQSASGEPVLPGKAAEAYHLREAVPGAAARRDGTGSEQTVNPGADLWAGFDARRGSAEVSGTGSAFVVRPGAGLVGLGLVAAGGMALLAVLGLARTRRRSRATQQRG